MAARMSYSAARIEETEEGFIQSIPATYTKDAGRSKVIMPYTQRAGLMICPFLFFNNHLLYAPLFPPCA